MRNANVDGVWFKYMRRLLLSLFISTQTIFAFAQEQPLGLGAARDAALGYARGVIGYGISESERAELFVSELDATHDITLLQDDVFERVRESVPSGVDADKVVGQLQALPRVLYRANISLPDKGCVLTVFFAQGFASVGDCEGSLIGVKEAMARLGTDEEPLLVRASSSYEPDPFPGGLAYIYRDTAVNAFTGELYRVTDKAGRPVDPVNAAATPELREGPTSAGGERIWYLSSPFDFVALATSAPHVFFEDKMVPASTSELDTAEAVPDASFLPLRVGEHWLLPVRFFQFVLGESVWWDEAWNTLDIGNKARLRLGENVVHFPVSGPGGTVTGARALEAAPQIIDDRLYVPLTVLEVLGYDYEWSADGRTLYVKKAER